MEENKEIYLARACKIVRTRSNLKKLELYDENIIVIKDTGNHFKEIITGIDFKRYPKSFYRLDEDKIYIFLDKRIDDSREGYNLIRMYYEERNEQNILHMIKWFDMDEVSRYKDYIERFEASNFDYETINNDLVRRKIKK